MGRQRTVLIKVIAGGGAGREESWDVAWVAEVSGLVGMVLGIVNVYLGRLCGLSARGVCRRREPL